MHAPDECGIAHAQRFETAIARHPGGEKLRAHGAIGGEEAVAEVVEEIHGEVRMNEAGRGGRGIGICALPPNSYFILHTAMKSLHALTFALLAVVCFSGCLQEEKIIKLKTDGSGTVEETMVMSKEVVAQMKQMADGFGALAGGKAKGEGAAAPFQIMDEKKLREAAGKMGEGVTFVSAKPVSTAMGEGFAAVYAFTDINKLKIDQNPGDNMPGADNPMMQKANKAKKEPVKFEFVKGSPASLTVKMPQPKQSDLPKERPPVPAGGQDMAGMMMQQMFKDMKVSLAIEVAGRIVQSNAEYKDATRVTLMEMDFNKVLANPEKFKALSQAQPKTIEEAKALVKGTEGIKAETQPVVTVKFQ